MSKLGSIILFALLVSIGCGDKQLANLDKQPTNQGSSSSRSPQPLSADFVGGDIGWIVARTGKLYHTDSGGAEWKQLTTNISGTLKQVEFIDENRGWAINDLGEVWQSKDGGGTWNRITKFDTPTNLSSIQFVDDLHGWVRNGFTSILRTEDGGINWETCDPTTNPQEIDEFLSTSYFLNANYGIVGASGGTIYITHDGGKTWTAKRIASKEAAIEYVFLIDEHTGWAGGFPSDICRTDDGFQTWRRQLLPTTIIEPVIFSIYFINKDEGWLAGFENESDSGKFTMHTLDGGNEWKQISTTTPEQFYHFIYFSDRSNGWALARNITVYSTTVYRTIDGGRTWQKNLSLD
jgi:photosystem II stability/assembly factor-like uncharacterized protein